MSLKVLIAGDFCPQDRVVEAFENNEFSVVLGEAKEQIAQVDYSLVNFECPLTYNGEKPVIKSGPSLQCSIKGLEAVKWAGFDGVTLANNHFLDYGEEGAKNTLDACNQLQLEHVGGGMNLSEASIVLYKKLKGLTLAVINCCENEFSIATEHSAGSCPLSPIDQFYKIKEAKEKADFVIVIVHGGIEFFNLPSPRMQQTYRFFIDAGADAVINHHQHCLSGYEVYKEKPIFYGLGNFCFDRKGKRKDNWNEGYLVSLTLEKEEKPEYDIIPYIQCDDNPCILFVDKDNMLEKIQELNRIIQSPDLLVKENSLFIEKNKGIYLLSLEPYTGHLGGLRERKILPSLLSKKYFLRLYGYLICESHFDRLKEILKKEIYG